MHRQKKDLVFLIHYQNFRNGFVGEIEVFKYNFIIKNSYVLVHACQIQDNNRFNILFCTFQGKTSIKNLIIHCNCWLVTFFSH